MYIISTKKLIKDECYPFEILVEVITSNYEFLLTTMNTFTGDTGKFYSKSCKVYVDTKDLKSLDHNHSITLSLEFLKHVLAHFNEAFQNMAILVQQNVTE